MFPCNKSLALRYAIIDMCVYVPVIARQVASSYGERINFSKCACIMLKISTRKWDIEE